MLLFIGCCWGGKDFSEKVSVAPTNVSTVVGRGYVTITWDFVFDDTAYAIYLSPTSGITKDNAAIIEGDRRVPKPCRANLPGDR